MCEEGFPENKLLGSVQSAKMLFSLQLKLIMMDASVVGLDQL